MKVRAYSLFFIATLYVCHIPVSALNHARTTSVEPVTLHKTPKSLGLSVKQAIEKYGPEAKVRLLSHFKKMNVAYPPKRATLLFLKSENALLVFARDECGKYTQIHKYLVISASGVAGPKLHEGDMQVPEGLYKVTRLDAMTHMALWLNYPNQTDKANAKTDQRTNLGGNIQIHGGVYSTGCIVITNEDMAELLVLANDISSNRVDVILSPCNLLTVKPDVNFATQPKWLPNLYRDLKTSLRILFSNPYQAMQ